MHVAIRHKSGEGPISRSNPPKRTATASSAPFDRHWSPMVTIIPSEQRQIDNPASSSSMASTSATEADRRASTSISKHLQAVQRLMPRSSPNHGPNGSMPATSIVPRSAKAEPHRGSKTIDTPRPIAAGSGNVIRRSTIRSSVSNDLRRLQIRSAMAEPIPISSVISTHGPPRAIPLASSEPRSNQASDDPSRRRPKPWQQFVHTPPVPASDGHARTTTYPLQTRQCILIQTRARHLGGCISAVHNKYEIASIEVEVDWKSKSSPSVYTEREEKIASSLPDNPQKLKWKSSP
ncbi:hypothetical protein ACLOJK_030062 [Asimina triloba]